MFNTKLKERIQELELTVENLTATQRVIWDMVKDLRDKDIEKQCAKASKELDKRKKPKLLDFKKRRQGLGLSVNELSKLSGISTSYIYGIESGQAKPSMKVASLLYGVFATYQANQNK